MPKLDAAGCCKVEQDTVGDTGSSARICSPCPCSRGCFEEVCGETCTHPAEAKSEELEGEDRWKELAAALAWATGLTAIDAPAPDERCPALGMRVTTTSRVESSEVLRT